MIGGLKRYKVSIALLIVSSIAGFYFYLKSPKFDIWIVEYEFQSADESELKDFSSADTVFKFENLVFRNYTGSIGDTLVDEGIRRYELKMYLPQPSKNRVIKLGDKLLHSRHVNIVNNRFRETQRNKSIVLYWVLFGFFLGIVVEFITRLTKKPRSN